MREEGVHQRVHSLVETARIHRAVRVLHAQAGLKAQPGIGSDHATEVFHAGRIFEDGGLLSPQVGTSVEHTRELQGG